MNVRLYVNACYAVFLCSAFWSVWTRRTVLQWDVAALVVVTAAACLLLVSPRRLWRMRRPTWWTPRSPPFPRGFCVGGQKGGEEKRRKREEQEGLNSLRAVPPERRTPQQVKRITDILLHGWPPRKRKKRRKKKLPQGVSSRGRARRRQRQCLFSGCSVFPSVVDWPQMLCIMAGMHQKDSSQRHSFGFFWEIPSGKCFVFCAMLGSTVDTIFASVCRGFLKRLTHCPRSSLLGSGMHGWFCWC